MVRSLLLATSLPPRLGGIETLLFETNRRLPQPPLVVVPGSPAASALPVRWTPIARRHKLLYRPTWFLHPALWYLVTLWRAAVDAARESRPNVLQAGHVYVAPLVWLLARRLGRPWLMYAYGQEVWRAGRAVGVQRLDRVLRGQAMRSADAVLVPGAFTAGLLSDWCVRPQRLIHVPYGAEPRPPAPPPRGTTLLSVSRLVPRKGIDTVIRALPRLDPSVQYRVVGSGPDEPRLRGLARAEGVDDRVHWLGRLASDALDEEYQRCALFVLPSRRTADGQLEGLGLVYFEAAAWGRPVLAGRSGGEVDAVVDGLTGVLVDGASHESVAGAVRDLLADPARLRRLGEAGRERVERTHNWTRAAQVVQHTLERLGRHA